MAKKDDEFGRMAVALKHVTQGQVAECLRTVAQLRREGKATTLARALVDKGYLTSTQVTAVAKELKRPRLSHIGQYRLIARIGQGGMGTVYKAKQESLDKIVAVKVLSPALARRGDYVQRFIREARSCGQLSHPNIVLGIAAGEADGYYYFAMEFVDGPSVKDILVREQKLGEPRALEIAAAIAAALEHAHEQNLVHRDIKPGNILLTADGTPKLADLGLAKEVETDQSITQAAIPIGTPYYISPEQVRGQSDVDQRADLYALGATLYHMVTGTVPFEGSTAAVVMTRHLNDPIPDPRTHTPGLSSAIVSIIRHAMEKDRERRYQKAAELSEDIEAARAGKPLVHATAAAARPITERAQRLADRRARAAARKRRNMLIGGIAAAVVAVAAIVGMILGSRKPEQPSGAVVRPRPSTPGKAAVTPRKPPRKTPRKTAKQPVAKQAPKPDPEAVLQELIAWAHDADDRAAIEKRFSAFVIRHAGAAVAQKAKAHLTGLRAQWKAMGDLEAAVREHVENRRFAAALALLGKPPFETPSDAQKKLLLDLSGKVKLAAAQYVDEKKREGEELIKNRQLGAARTLYDELAQLGLPAAKEASRDALARIGKLEAGLRTRRARRAFAALLVKAAPLVAAGKLDDASKLFDAAQAKGDEQLASLLGAGQKDIRRIAEFLGAIEAEFQKLAAQGGSARIRGIMRPVTKVEHGVIHCTIGGRKDTFGIHELTLRDLRELKSVKAHPLAIPLWQLYRGEAQAAKGALQKLATSARDPNVARWLEQIAWLEAIGREDEAKGLLAKARSLFQRSEWGATLQALARLRTGYDDTGFVETHVVDINTLADSCARELAARRREAETIRPFIDVTEKCGDLARVLQRQPISGGWVMDIDNDGRLDIALDVRNAPTPHIPILLNRSKGGTLRFVEATRIADLTTGEEPICWVDLDGDGDLDVVCRGLWSRAAGKRTSDHQKLALYENRGPEANPMFRLLPARAITAELAKAPGFAGFGFGNIAVLDANGDGRSDILAQFVSGKRTLSLFLAVRGKPFTFQDVSREVGFVLRKGGQIVTPPYLQVNAWPNYVVFDADGDHRADFIFNTDGGLLFRNKGGRSFTHVADTAVKYDTAASPQTGNNPRIVPAVADYDNDGDMDILIPQNGKNLLLRNDGGRFTDAMHTTGPMATDAADSLWATWADVNNDGLPDLYVCNHGERNRLYIQKPNHAFVDKAEDYGVAGRRDDATNFVAFGDFDRDGDIDMLVLQSKGRHQLLLNPYIRDDNHYSLNVLLRTRLGAIGAKIYLLDSDGKIAGLQQVCRVEGFNRQTPREAFFGVPTPGTYRVRVVLSSRRRIEKTVRISPARPNILVIRK